jgi:hypothetical protein
MTEALEREYRDATNRGFTLLGEPDVGIRRGGGVFPTSVKHSKEL